MAVGRCPVPLTGSTMGASLYPYTQAVLLLLYCCCTVTVLLHQGAFSLLICTLLLEFCLKIDLYFGPERLQERSEISEL